MIPILTKLEKLERLLSLMDMNLGDLRELNQMQLTAIEVDYFNRYNENISLTVSGKRE